MSPPLADLARKASPSLHAKVSGLGAVQSIKFVGGLQGADMYQVAHEHGVSHWIIGLDAEGRIEGLQLLPDS